MIQEEKDRLGRLDDNHNQQFNQKLLELTDGEEWILQVPDYVWTRNAMIHEFLEHGTGDVMETCSAIVSVLRSKQKVWRMKPRMFLLPCTSKPWN